MSHHFLFEHPVFFKSIFEKKNEPDNHCKYKIY